MDDNYGHEVVTKCFYDFLPQYFIITDPDLQFNINLPNDFIQQLINISEERKSYKTGFALDISEPNLFNPKMKLCNRTIEQWEARFWKILIADPKYILYMAEIDTTFCLYNKKFFDSNKLKAIRVAGNFICKHLPWYIDHKVPEDEMNYYLRTKKVGDWIKKTHLPNISGKKYLIISPQTNIEQKIKVLAVGILLAKQTGRIPVYCWEEYDKYFQDDEILRSVDTLNINKVDLVLTEWISGNFWYEKQSSGQKKFKSDLTKKINVSADVLLDPNIENLEYIMLETSLIPKISKFENTFSSEFDKIMESLRSISKKFNSNISSKYLIISPQAGLGNRLRALSTGILLAQQTGRIPLHCWIPETGTSNIPNVQDIKKLGFSDYFDATDKLKLITPSEVPPIDKVLTEWIPGDYWYQFQSTAQKRWNVTYNIKVNENLDILAKDLSSTKTVLLETSLSIKLNSEVGGCKDEEFKNKLGEIYTQYFIPKQRFLDIIKTLPDIDLGISIRRGDLLKYYSEARQDPNDILDWLVRILKVTNSKNICIFSDDHKFRNDFKEKLLERIQIDIINLPNNIILWEMGFLEFLVLSSKCKMIYGTPMSSFAEEAGLFRAKHHYQKILAPIEEEIKINYIKDVLPKVTIAILCKTKAHVLPLYLRCIYNLCYPKSLINLYIRTNDNKDNSAEVLKTWINNIKNEYNEIFYDESSINKNLLNYGGHEWNAERFGVLGKIRQDSIQYAKDKGTDYFVVDCDNFVKSNTLIMLVQSKKDVIGPYLRLICVGPSISMYSNYHADISKNGYHIENKNYNDIWSRTNPGLHKVNVIHCTYYIQNKVLDKVNYFDNTKDHEYVIFSRNLRNAGIQQYIDNIEIYGYLTFEDTSIEFWKKMSIELMKELLL